MRPVIRPIAVVLKAPGKDGPPAAVALVPVPAALVAVPVGAEVRAAAVPQRSQRLPLRDCAYTINILIR